MKRIQRLLIRLYPAWWRNRYGGELEALLEDSGSHDVWDLLRGAMEMQMKTWPFGRIVIACGIVGVAMAAVAVFAFPPPYSSTTILRIPGGDRPGQVLADMVNDAAVAALTRNSLVDIIATQNLYVQERKRMPMIEVIDRLMRPSIHIQPLILFSASDSEKAAIGLRFDYPDPSKTQQTTQALAERFSGFQVLDPPSAPQRLRENYRRFRIAAFGLLAGLFSGVGVALFWRRYTFVSNKPGKILTPLKRFFLCFGISVLAMAFCAMFQPGLFSNPLAWRFQQIVFLPFQYLVEGFHVRPTAFNIVLGFLLSAATWTGILYAFCALVELPLRKITHRRAPSPG